MSLEFIRIQFIHTFIDRAYRKPACSVRGKICRVILVLFGWIVNETGARQILQECYHLSAQRFDDAHAVRKHRVISLLTLPWITLTDHCGDSWRAGRI